MRIAIALVLSFAIGAACRIFDIPVPSPPMLPGALLVLATTLGYMTADRAMGKNKPSPPAAHSIEHPSKK